jgi:hypothetical protein
VTVDYGSIAGWFSVGGDAYSSAHPTGKIGMNCRLKLICVLQVQTLYRMMRACLRLGLVGVMQGQTMEVAGMAITAMRSSSRPMGTQCRRHSSSSQRMPLGSISSRDLEGMAVET